MLPNASLSQSPWALVLSRKTLSFVRANACEAETSPFFAKQQKAFP